MILNKNKKYKYYAIFCKKEYGIFKRLSKKRIRSTTKKVRYKKGTYLLNMLFPTYARGLKVFYFVDVSGVQLLTKKVTEIKNRQIVFKGNDEKPVLTPEMMDKLVSQNIVSQLTSNLSGDAIKMNIISIVLGLIIGALSGFLMAGYV